MDPNLYRLLASGAFPSPLPSPQESVPMVFPMPMFPQPMQSELLRQQMAFQQLLCQQYQQALSSLASMTAATVAAPKAISPVMPAPTPQLLTLPTKLVQDLVIPQPKIRSPVPTTQNQALAAALASVAQPVATVPVVTVPIAPPSRSPESEGHCTSPSTSSQPKEEDEDLFVDVESVDSKLANKDRRKAHVEFFRKVKSIRQREKSLKCAICYEVVPLQDNAIQLHVNHHADAGGFRCQLCGFELKEKFKVYKHMRDKHPTKADLIEDRRNMSKLSAYIEVVFPRAYVRPKKDSTKEVESLLKQLEEKKLAEVSCALCDKVVVSSRASITKHVGLHPSYRCKSCKVTTDTEKEQEQHQAEAHAVSSPRLTGEYNLCTATDVVAKQIYRCFSHALGQ